MQGGELLMVKIFIKMKAQYIKTEMEYKSNFWMMLFSGVLTKLLSMAVPFIIYQNIPSIDGWDENEIYLIMSFLFISEGLCSVLFDGIWKMPEMVFSGQFDSVLSRPVSPLYQILSYGMGLQGIGVVAFGMVSLNMLLVKLDKMDMKTIMTCLFLIVCGTIICMSIYLLSTSFIFWYDSGGKTIVPYTVASFSQYARYPVGIYPKGMQIILLFVIPYAFISVIPVEILRGNDVMLHVVALITVCVIFFLVAKAVFYRGIRKYESVGM